MQLGAGHCTSACLFVKWESYPSKVMSQECHFYKVLRASQALQVPLKCLVINPFINLEEILAVQIHFSRYTKHVSCLTWLSFFPLGFCAWTNKGVQIPAPQIPAVSPVLGCSLLPNRLLCEKWQCWNLGCAVVLHTLLPGPGPPHRPPGCAQENIKHCCHLQISCCSGALLPVLLWTLLILQGRDGKTKHKNALWIGVSIRKLAFGFLKIVYILFVKKWNS